MVLVQTHSN